ncbi:MAG: undecaprenyl/decaprenyl-phosphate alpha-N-acetylglucosaminyl 1-phosphate transferase [Frankiales bacterium]|nr:undecaprenyl/decaprenyl-phosphate alpha-N-acetylglucosaminyl 1-phosphate transferase [Frankiales bacterium]
MREYLITAFVAAAVTYLLTPFVRRGAELIGAYTPVRDRDVHTIPTPRLGGLAIFGGVGAALLVASRLPTLHRVFDTSEIRGVFFGGLLLVAIGAADDKWGLDALTKLAGQILAAGVMVLEGVQILYFPVSHNGALSLGPDLGVPLTVIFVVVTINAVNFIDGLDGLAAGVVAIASLSFFAYSYELSVVQHFDRATTPTLVTAVLTGACLGFLPHNFNPARVFMGDSGSMLLGLMLSSSAVTLTGQLDPSATTAVGLFPTLIPLLLPLAVLAVPFVDLVLAIARRTRTGQAPWAPDKLHLHHRLLRLGHSHARAVLIMYLWSALIAGGAVTIAFAHDRPLLVLSGYCVAAAVLVVASSIPRLRHHHTGG